MRFSMQYDVLWLITKETNAMSINDVLTLLLVVFAMLSYIDNHHNRKYTHQPFKVMDAYFYHILKPKANRKVLLICFPN